MTNLDICKIQSLKFSVSRYRQGQITVRIDFVHKFLTWKDSNRWFNDFVRSLNDEQIKKILQTLPPLLASCRVASSYRPDPEGDYNWTLYIEPAKPGIEPITCAGRSSHSADLQAFLQAVEKAGEKLIDPIGGH